MFGYIIAAAECGLVHETGNLGICTNWSPMDVPDAPIIHYCQSIQSNEGEALWNKRSYQPWEKIEDPQRAQHDYGRDLFNILNRFIETKDQNSHEPSRVNSVGIMNHPDRPLVEMK